MTTDFGRDIWCDDSLRTGRMATGSRLVAQGAYHRLITPRGTLRGGDDEADFGLDLAGIVGSVTSDADARRLEGMVRGEIRKDERIASVSVVVTRTVTGAEVSLRVDIAAETDSGPFDLVLGVSLVSVEVLSLEAA